MKPLIWDFDGTPDYCDGEMWSASLPEVILRELPERGLGVDKVRSHLQAGYLW